MNDYIDDHTIKINTHKRANQNTQKEKTDNKEASTGVPAWVVGLIIAGVLIVIVFGILLLIYFLKNRNKKKMQLKPYAHGSKADNKMGKSSKSSISPNKMSNSTDTTELSTMKEPENEQEPNAQSITKAAKTATSTTKSSEIGVKTKSPTIYMETLKTLTSPLTHQSSTQISKQQSKQEGINGRKRNKNGFPLTFLRNTFHAKHTAETSQSHYIK